MKEDHLFKLIKEKMIKDLEKLDTFNSIDCYSKKYNARIELKCRKDHWENLIIQRDKYDELIQYENAYYINSTPEGVFSFNLHKLPELEWFYKRMKTSHSFFRKDLYTDKLVSLLPINLAEDITDLLC